LKILLRDFTTPPLSRISGNGWAAADFFPQRDRTLPAKLKRTHVTQTGAASSTTVMTLPPSVCDDSVLAAENLLFCKLLLLLESSSAKGGLVVSPLLLFYIGLRSMRKDSSPNLIRHIFDNWELDAITRNDGQRSKGMIASTSGQSEHFANAEPSESRSRTISPCSSCPGSCWLRRFFTTLSRAPASKYRRKVFLGESQLITAI
jgi:hypothetical protein